MRAPAALSRFAEAALRGLGSVEAGTEPPWLAELRSSAASWIREHGFPHAKQEAWRFTSLAALMRTPFDQQPAPRASADRAVSAATAARADDGAWRLTLRDGVLAPSAEPPRAQLRIASWLGSADALPASTTSQVGRHLGPGNAFRAQNAALMRDLVVIEATGGSPDDPALHLCVESSPCAAPSADYPRVLVLCRAGSHLRLVEEYLPTTGADHLTNAVTEVVLEEGASLVHQRLMHGTLSGFLLSAVGVSAQERARYHLQSFTLGGRLSRSDLEVRLLGAGSCATLEGAYVAGSEEQVDHHTRVDHLSARTTSHERFVGVIDGSGRGVFDALACVHPLAMATEARQELRHLLLSDDARVHVKPQLEIHADEVQCSHGATVGQLDPQQVFYLQARGIDATAARAVLTQAFCRAQVGALAAPELRARVDSALAARLPGGSLARELVGP